MKTITLNTSIASVLHITGVGHRERVDINITNNTDSWSDTYKFFVYESKHKNTDVKSTDTLSNSAEDFITIVDGEMRVRIFPENQEIDPGNYYYEIFNTTDKRIEFLGDLIIEK